MKRFHFSLRPLALLRAHHEQSAREAFAVAARACAQSEGELSQTRRRVAEFERAVSAGRAGRFDPAVEVQNLAGYRRECASEVEAERHTVAARAGLERGRVAYVEAHQKLEVVNRLEEKARAQHRSEAAREEQAAFDDFAGRRHFTAKNSPANP